MALESPKNIVESLTVRSYCAYKIHGLRVSHIHDFKINSHVNLIKVHEAQPKHVIDEQKLKSNPKIVNLKRQGT